MARDLAWYQKLGCDQDPFSPNPAVDRFYFETPALASHLNTLTSVASKGEFIGLVKGERGIGKTTLLNQMARRFRDDPDVAFTRVSCTEGCSLIQSLGISSGLTEEELAVEPRRVLIDHLTRLRTGGQKVVAAIDDAHLLSPQDLAMLIRIGLSPNASGLVHTVLFAEADIEARLWLSAINDPLPLDRLYTLILTPLASEQTQAYLSHRLAAVGLDRVNLSGSEAAAIQRRAEGIPAAINEQASQRLARRYGPMLGRSLGIMQHVRPAWVAGIAGVAVLAGAAIWQRDALTEWASSVDISLPFGEDITGTEVAIAIPDPTGSSTSPEISPPRVMPPPDELDPSADTTEEPAPELTTPPAVETPETPVIASDTTTPTLLPTMPEASTPTPPAAMPPSNPAVAPGAVASVPPETLSLPENLRERLQERERERQQALSSDGTPTPPVATTDATTPDDDVPPPMPNLATPAGLADFPRVATSDHLVMAASAPLTPETPTTPITGRSGEATEVAATPVRPRPRPQVPPVVAETGVPAPEETPPTETTVVEPNATETVATAEPETTPPARRVPRPRPKPAVPPPQPVAAAPAAADPAPSPAPDPAPATTAQPQGADWFRQQSPDNYVIQLLVASEEAKLRSYVASQRFPTTPAYFQRARGSYVLVVGPYANEREARQDINRLPADIQRNGPWIRRIASVQQELP